MRVLFLIFHGFGEHNGISKKIKYQVQALKNIGVEAFLCYTDFDSQGNQARFLDNSVLENFGKGILSKLKKRLCFGSVVKFARDKKIDLVYVRNDFNASPVMGNLYRNLKKAGCKIVMEIPTYPYDGELAKFTGKDRIKVVLDKHFRNSTSKYVDKIATFTNEKQIFGRPTINISNGIDFSSIKENKPKEKLRINPKTGKYTLNLISVSEVHFWHGLDRVITGMGEYFSKENTGNEQYPDILFHVVGRGFGEEFEQLKQLAEKLSLQDKVIFYGNKSGRELDEIFALSDFAIASLGRHRSGITRIKTLKNREYAARGVPFIYSEIDEDFESMPYIIKAAADDGPIDICKIVDFYKNLSLTPHDIRTSIESTLSWDVQMKKIIDNI